MTDATSSPDTWYAWCNDFFRPLASGNKPHSEHGEFWCSKLEVRDAEGSGRGVFLSPQETASPGELLVVEQACYDGSVGVASKEAFDAMASKAWDEADESIKQRWRMLSDGRKPAPMKYNCRYSEWGSDGESKLVPSSAWLCDTIRLNGMSRIDILENPSGLRHVGHREDVHVACLSLYASGGLMNHSCYPTVEKLAFRGWLVIRSSRVVEGVSSELSHPYVDVRSPLSFRQEYLKRGWGFSCECYRCLLEQEVWADIKLQLESVEIWGAYQKMMVSKHGGLKGMQLLVQAASDVTGKALEQFLVRDVAGSSGASSKAAYASWRSQFQAAFDISPRLARCMMIWEDVGIAGETAAAKAFARVRNILLASVWLAPATQLSWGLIAAGHFGLALDLLTKVVAVNQEVLPTSGLHVASVLHRVVCVAETRRPRNELFASVADASELVGKAYGDGIATLQVLMEPRLSKHDPAAQSLADCINCLGATAKMGRSLSAIVARESSATDIPVVMTETELDVSNFSKVTAINTPAKVVQIRPCVDSSTNLRKVDLSELD
eukprot:TRINITY_DN52494_c0_g1_i1.p1 TRINITY_DN52494_c0_g1~~TRINITY_DN52494_c0_g1_i1.p1  ORF type:complete len:551 (-),score=84.21 TRINITY_DN52494_c0_g1_i1:398-2050(-)